MPSRSTVTKWEPSGSTAICTTPLTWGCLGDWFQGEVVEVVDEDRPASAAADQPAVVAAQSQAQSPPPFAR